MYKILLMMVYLPYQLVSRISSINSMSMFNWWDVPCFHPKRQPGRESRRWKSDWDAPGKWLWNTENTEVLSCFEGMFFQHFYPPGNYHIPWKLMVGRSNFLLEWSPLMGHVNFAGRGKWISYFLRDVVPTFGWRARKDSMNFCTVHVLLASS